MRSKQVRVHLTAVEPKELSQAAGEASLSSFVRGLLLRHLKRRKNK
ncbi:MAG: hypothetical protein IH881_19790 [Myxococcales bacterium]|nr:hypothetical protein [Myxococcales bacterium]